MERLAALDADIDKFKNKRNALTMDLDFGELMKAVSSTTRFISEQHLEKGMSDTIIEEVYDKCRKARQHRMVAELGY